MPQEKDTNTMETNRLSMPPVGPLDSEGVKLLVKGDAVRGPNGRIEIVATANPDFVVMVSGNGYMPSLVTFIGRHDADGWMPWSGGENPVPGAMVECRFASGAVSEALDSECFGWDRHNDPVITPLYDIIAFRLRWEAGEGAGSYVGDVGDLLKRARNAVRNGGTIKNLDHANDVVLIDKLADALEATTTPPTDPRLDRLKLAICGGEDVPGSIAAVTVEDCERFLVEERQRHEWSDTQQARLDRAIEALEKAVWSLSSFGQLAADEEGGNTEGLGDEVIVRMTFPDPEFGGEKTLLGELFIRAFRKAKAATDECRQALASIRGEA